MDERVARLRTAKLDPLNLTERFLKIIDSGPKSAFNMEISSMLVPIVMPMAKGIIEGAVKQDLSISTDRICREMGKYFYSNPNQMKHPEFSVLPVEVRDVVTGYVFADQDRFLTFEDGNWMLAVEAIARILLMSTLGVEPMDGTFSLYFHPKYGLPATPKMVGVTTTNKNHDPDGAIDVVFYTFFKAQDHRGRFRSTKYYPSLGELEGMSTESAEEIDGNIVVSYVVDVASAMRILIREMQMTKKEKLRIDDEGYRYLKSLMDLRIVDVDIALTNFIQNPYKTIRTEPFLTLLSQANKSLGLKF